MKPTSLTSGRSISFLLVAMLAIALVSWDQHYAPGHYYRQLNDTTPRKKTAEREKKVRDLDEVIDEINNADLQIDQQKIKEEIERSLKDFDGEKIRRQVEEALKQVDLDKMRVEMERSLASIDMKKAKEEMEKAFRDIDLSKMQEEINSSLSKIDWDKMKTDMKKVQEVDMKKMQADLDKMQEELKQIGPKLEKEMEKLKGEMEKLKVEMQEYKEFVDGLNDQGYINKKKDYSIKYNNGELLINNAKADQKVLDTYRSFLEKHKKFTIEKSGDDFNIQK